MTPDKAAQRVAGCHARGLCAQLAGNAERSRRAHRSASTRTAGLRGAVRSGLRIRKRHSFPARPCRP